jgi:hypothetical protein
MQYSAQSKSWKDEAKEQLAKNKHKVTEYPRSKQVCIFFGSFMFFMLMTIWFKSNFERLSEENEVYELNSEIKVHFQDFMKQFNKSYSDPDELAAR